jgi:heme-degrading monooxygenase HmoA
MIVRSWRGRTTRANASAYVRHVTQKVFATLKKIRGHRGAYLLQREEADSVKFVVLTLWDSMQAIREFAGEQVERAVIEPEAQAVLADFDKVVEHYELVYDSVKDAGPHQ